MIHVFFLSTAINLCVFLSEQLLIHVRVFLCILIHSCVFLSVQLLIHVFVCVRIFIHSCVYWLVCVGGVWGGGGPDSKPSTPTSLEEGRGWGNYSSN